MRHTVRLSTQHRVLILDSDDAERTSVASSLRDAGFSVYEARSLAEALHLVEHESPEVVVTDLGFDQAEAMRSLRELRAATCAPSVVLLASARGADLAARAIEQGAETFLVKPANAIALAACVRVATERRRLDPARAEPSPASVHSAYVWRSDSMRELEDRASRLRDADCAVLVLGETGTGKSVLARSIHDRSGRGIHPFVDVDCAGLRPERAEIELFGEGDKPGLFEAAQAGSLCFDDVGDLDLSVQSKVLRAVEEKRFRRAGDTREIVSAARILAASHHDLLEDVADKRFRADLFYRVSAMTLQLPPLRDRRADIVSFAEHVLVQTAPGMRFDPAAAALLLDHDWPGNLRELRNVVESAALLGRDGVIARSDLMLEAPAQSQRGFSSRTMRSVTAEEAAISSGMRPKTLDEIEREHIRRALESESGHVESAAKLLGIPRSTLYQKLKNYGWGSRSTGGGRR